MMFTVITDIYIASFYFRRFFAVIFTHISVLEKYSLCHKMVNETLAEALAHLSYLWQYTTEPYICRKEEPVNLNFVCLFHPDRVVHSEPTVATGQDLTACQVIPKCLSL